MATTWAQVAYDIKGEDQVQTVLAGDGSITSTVMLTYAAVTDQTSRGTTVEAQSASDGTTTVPAVGSLISLGGGTFTVMQSQPRRSGPYSFTIQVQAVAKYAPVPPAAKSNITLRFSGQQYTQDASYDSTGKAIVNSAGQSFNPSVPVGIYDERIEVNYTTLSDQSASFNAVRGKVNSVAISFAIRGVSRSFPARHLRCEDVQQSETLPQQNGNPTYAVTASFTNREDGYTTTVLDQGFYSKDPATGKLVPIKDANGTAVATQVLLDGTGQPLVVPSSTTTSSTGPTDPSGSGDDDGAIPENVHTPNVTAHWIEFKLESEADFTSVFTGLS